MLVNAIGIYALHHTPTNHVYIGSSRRLVDRIRQHKFEVTHGIHANRRIRALSNNWEEFSVSVTYLSTIEEAKLWEKRLIELFHDNPLCLNIATDPFRPWVGTGRVTGGNRSPRSDSFKEGVRKRLSKRVMVNGVIYDSVTKAAEATGISIGHISNTVRSGKRPSWKYLEGA